MTNSEIEEYHELMEEIERAEEIEREKFIKALDFFKENIDYPYQLLEDNDFDLEDFFENNYSHVGYCHINEIDYRNSFHPNIKCYKIVEDDLKIDKIFERYDNKDGFHYLIYQTCGYLDDDYSGYLLFPMKDNKYWVVSFSC